MFRNLWLLGLALMFIPDYGLSRETYVGVIQPSDWMLLLLLPALLIGPARRVRFPSGVRAAFAAFVAVALVSTLATVLRYPGAREPMIQIGIEKLGKFAIYALIGPLVARRILSEADYRRTVAALAVGALITVWHLSAIAYQKWDPAASAFRSGRFAYIGYRENPLGVTLSVLVCFLIGLSFTGRTRAYAFWLGLGMVTLLAAGMVLSGGRAGWICTAVGLAFLIAKTRASWRPVFASVLLVALTSGMVSLIPQVRWLAERFVDVNARSPQVQQLGLSDMYRVTALAEDLPKIVNAPFVGVGLFNRGEYSGLTPWGSHNAFAQMALETGVLGLLCILWLMKGMWSSAAGLANQPARRNNILAFQAAMVAFCVGCLSGEYLYGDVPLMVLSVLYSITIALGRLDAHAMRAELSRRGLLRCGRDGVYPVLPSLASRRRYHPGMREPHR